MARSFTEIQQSILEAKEAAAELNALEVLTTSEQTLHSATSNSKVGIWRLWVWIFSFALWLHEKIVYQNAQNSRPHTIRWYRDQAMNFLDGLSLVWIDGQYNYNLNGVVDAADRKIIDRCAILESSDGELVIKVATDNSGTIEPLSTPQLLRFVEYLNLIKDAGNRLRVINEEADKLKITIDAYVDVSIIDLATGKLLNVSEDIYPLKDAVKNYLENLQFDGAFVKEFFKNALQTAPGVKLPILQNVEWKYAAFDWETIGEWKVPEAGYFKIDDIDLTINYLQYELA